MQVQQEKIIQDIVRECYARCCRLDALSTIKVISYLLTENRINNKCVVGSAYLHGASIAIHYWIELENDFVIDITFKDWIKQPESPDGLIYLPSSPAKYRKYKDFVEVLSKMDFATITQRDAGLN